MTEQPILHAIHRSGVGSNDARKVRSGGRIPGIIFGHGESELISFDAAEFRKTVHPDHYGSIVVRVELAGKETVTALIKAVQAFAIKKQIFSIELQRVQAEDSVNVAVPVVITGDPDAFRAGAILEQMLHSVNLRCRALDVPEQIIADISHLKMGEALHAGQLPIPAQHELLDKPDEVIAVLLTPTVQTAAEAEAEEPKAAVAAEPEVK